VLTPTSPCANYGIVRQKTNLSPTMQARLKHNPHRYSSFILGRESLTLRMSYGRNSGYGDGGNRSFNRGSTAAKPVEEGKEYEVDVTEISRQGDGIARVEGFVVFNLVIDIHIPFCSRKY